MPSTVFVQQATPDRRTRERGKLEALAPEVYEARRKERDERRTKPWNQTAVVGAHDDPDPKKAA